MPVPPAALELLIALSPVLARWGGWYVFGAQAVIAYGFPRLSADVDVTLALTPDDPERFADDMAVAGFSLRVTDPAFVRRTRVKSSSWLGDAHARCHISFTSSRRRIADAP